MRPLISSMVRVVAKSAGARLDCCWSCSPSRIPAIRSWRIAFSAGVSPRGSLVWVSRGLARRCGAITSRTSIASVTGCAPCLRILLHPSESGLVIFPGTENTSLPWERACPTVLSVPLLAAASVTITASATPLTRRFLSRKLHFVTCTSSPSRHSDMIAPP